MKAIEGSVTRLPGAAEPSTGTGKEPVTLPDSAVEPVPCGRLLAALQRGADIDPGIFSQLARRLSRETEATRIWYALRCLELSPLPDTDLEIQFEAVKRLAQAESVFIRSAAYEWLAGLHRRSLRYEMRAKRVLREGLDREQGLARTRLRELMRAC
jgi:hypothetical protein